VGRKPGVFLPENGDIREDILMELTPEQLKAIQEASREIEFGQITVKFAGNPHNIVDIVAEKTIRFHHEKAKPSTVKPMDRKGSGRY
jgi:hypothetical protein